jgi:capsular exopolysaccharide synthesis family protein
VSIDQIAAILWRRRLSFVAALVAGIAAVVAITITLPKTYSATATLYVGGRVDPDAFVDTSRIEQQTRTYATLSANPNVAEIVAEALPLGLTRSQLLRRMSFAPVERTPLIQIAAEAKSPGEAQLIANTYAREFVDRMNELFSEGRAPAEISISEEAVEPTSPSKPNPPLYIGFGALLSLVLALAVALLRERLDTRVRVAPEDDSVLGQPIVARIPRMDGRGGPPAREIADRFGLLKTNLDFFDESPARIVVITSPGVGEGKSTVAANLALACAAEGERVVLIEGDLRRPGLDNTAISDRAERSRVGLSNYLAAAASEEEILTFHPDHPELAVIWSGLIPPNPSALLSSHRLDTLFSWLRLDYDRVIIDSCPISVGPDASVIASRVDGALYIVDERKTKRTEAQAGLNQLRGVRAHMLGVVLNRATTTGGEGYYYYSGDGAGKEEEALTTRPDRDRGQTESFS